MAVVSALAWNDCSTMEPGAVATYAATPGAVYVDAPIATCQVSAWACSLAASFPVPPK